MQNEYLKKSKFDDSVFQVCKWNHPLKGDVSILTNTETLEKFICCETISSSLRELHVIQNYLNRLLAIRKGFNGMLIDYSIEVKRRKTNVFFVIKEYYNYIEHTMKDYLVDETNQDIIDSERLSHIFYQILRIMGDLQDRGIFHGFINPACLLIVSPNKYGINLVPSTIVSSKQSYFEHIRMKHNLNFSPELLKDLNIGFLSNISLYKNDVFCFAVTILQLTLREQYEDIYVKSQIDKCILELNYNKFAQKYKDNRLIITSVKAMLNLDEVSRPDFRKMQKQLPSYDKIIEYFKYMNKLRRSRSQQTSEKMGTPSFAKENKNTSKEGFISFFDHKDNKKANIEHLHKGEDTQIKPIKSQCHKRNVDNLDLIQTTNKNKILDDENSILKEESYNVIADLSNISDFEERLNKNMQEFDQSVNIYTKEVDLKLKKFDTSFNKNDDLGQILKKSFLNTKRKAKDNKSNDKLFKQIVQVNRSVNKLKDTKGFISINTSKEKLKHATKKMSDMTFFRRSFNDEKPIDSKNERINGLISRNASFSSNTDLLKKYRTLTNSKLI